MCAIDKLSDGETFASRLIYMRVLFPRLQGFWKFFHKSDEDRQSSKCLLESRFVLMMSNRVSHFVPKIFNAHSFTFSASTLIIDEAEVLELQWVPLRASFFILEIQLLCWVFLDYSVSCCINDFFHHIAGPSND